MQQGIPVSIYKYKWPTGRVRFTMIFVAISVVPIACTFGNMVLPWVLVGGSIAILIANEIIDKIHSRAQRWLIDTGSGFCWRSRRSETQFEDRDVTAVRLTRIPQISEGVVKSVVRCFEAWTAESPRPLRMCNQLTAVASDPLEPVIARIVNELKQRTAAAMASGGLLEGEGWILAGTVLTIKGGGQNLTIPLHEIQQVAPCNGILGVWRCGENLPAGGIRPDSKNVQVLRALLDDWVSVRDENGAASTEGSVVNEGLGQLLFARRRSELAQAAAILAFLFAAVGGVIVFSPELRLYALGGFALALACYAASRFVPIDVFQCYEHGFMKARWYRRLIVPYHDILEFNYFFTNHFHQGRFVGTEVEIIAKTKETSLHFTENAKFPEPNLQELCRDVSEIVANKMLVELQSGRAVLWLNDVTLLPEGLLLGDTKNLGGSDSKNRLLPYEQIACAIADDGAHGMVFSRQKPENAIFTTSRRSPNFFPIFLLLRWLTQDGTGEQLRGEGDGRTLPPKPASWHSL